MTTDPSLFTSVAAQPLPFRLAPPDGVLTLGSCFADEMAVRLAAGGFCVEQNPFGTLFNPASVASALRRILADSEVGEADLVQGGGLYHSWHHHGRFSRPEAQQCLDACNAALHRAHAALRQCRLIILTFGTAWVFEHEGQIVANCHRLPPQLFVRRRMSVAEIVALWQPLLAQLAQQLAQPPEVLLTVSPIRHLADGAHGNQLSKATLLLAAEELVTAQASAPLPRLHYFPAYELLLDQLRDYRFYAPDMVHPSTLAADIIYRQLQLCTMTPAVIQQTHNNAKQQTKSSIQ